MLLESESVENLGKFKTASEISSAHDHAGSRLEQIEDTEEGDEDEENIDMFDAFKFKSFRT